MLEDYSHYISRNIKTYYKRRLFSPVIYLLLLLLVWNLFSLTDLFFPKTLTDADTVDSIYRQEKYITATLEDLHFTGYTREMFGNVSGYYYYTLRGEECFVVLLAPDTCEEGLPEIASVTISAEFIQENDAFHVLLDNIAMDLNWSSSSIRSKMSPFYLSEPDYNLFGNVIFLLFLLGTGGYALITILLYLVYIANPVLSPPCQDLGLFGNAKELLAQAEEELATLPQLATDDIFITEHFFILTSIYGNAIIPIKEIIWIYKYSTLHKLFWYHFSISYTLHISANKYLYVQCPKTIKSDIDGIIDYLSEANHDILVGFNEANRLKVEEIQGTPLNFKKILSFLKKRI